MARRDSWIRRLRRLYGGGPVSALLVAGMLLGCVFLWVGVPLAWLWIGSQVQAATDLGTAMAAMAVGVLATILVAVRGLAWLNRRHVELRERRNLPVGEHTALEVMLVTSAGLAIIAFGIWFLGFSGSSPIPLNIGY